MVGLPQDGAASEPQRLPALDGVRAIAAISVVAFHSLLTAGTTPADGVLRSLNSPLWAGVDLFFVLSGFLITGILLDTRGKPNALRNFYARRALRILPLYYLVVAGAVIGLPLLLDAFNVGAADRTALDGWMGAPLSQLTDNQIWLWTYANNWLQARGSQQLPGFGHFWSLAIEEQFYVLWPLIALRVSPRNVLRICVGGAALAASARIAFVLAGSDPFAVARWTPTRVDGLLLGGAAAAVLRLPDVADKARRMAPHLFRGAILVLVVLAATLDWHLTAELPRVAMIGFPALAVAFAAAIMLVANGDTSRTLQDALGHPALRWIGRYSYGIYVFHWPVSLLVLRVIGDHGTVAHGWRFGGADAIATFALTVALSTLLAVTSYQLWEKRWLALKSRFGTAAAVVPA